MKEFLFNTKPRFVPEYDKRFKPAILANRAFLKAVGESGDAVPAAVAIERNDGMISTCKTSVFGSASDKLDENCFYIERLVKTLLWLKGGWKIIWGGPPEIGEYLKKVYSPGGTRDFDFHFMGKVYERTFTVELTDYDKVPESMEKSTPTGRHLDGCRIGFDAGGSDRKVSAVIDGEAVYSEEVVWHPKLNSDPEYHYQGILDSMKSAASKLPRVDAIGVSAAGIYIHNKAVVASLFIKVPEDLFEKRIKNIFTDIAKEFGDVPIVVANDGDVTALAGAMSMNVNNVLGIAMGTSEAAGYVDPGGNITGWLNELAFVPVDFNPAAMTDEWSGDFGCGVKYFSQDGVIKLAQEAGIEFGSATPAEKLKAVQNLSKDGDARASKIFECIGIYLGYAIAYYAEFYNMEQVLILGRVTSGEGGGIILDKANEVLNSEFPDLAKTLRISLPDEANRRVGQSIAAASLPNI